MGKNNSGETRKSVRLVMAATACLAGILAICCPRARGQSYIYNAAQLPVGNSPSAVIAADFNGDGILDLAVTNQSDNTVSVLLGKPSGGFASHVDYATGNNPVALVAADFNGDGKPDLAVVNLNCTTQGCGSPGSVSILINEGDGTFAPHVDYPIGNNAAIGFIGGIVTADFNGDKKADLAVLDNANSLVTVLLGNGDGTFQPQLTAPVGTSPTSLASGDFNGDGKIDLITSNVGSGTVTVLLSKGDGTFTRVDSPTNVFPPQNSSALAVGDFNGDGKLDAIVTEGASQAILLLEGNGDGTFQSPVNIPISLVGGPGLLLAEDFNHDGKLDLEVSNSTAIGLVAVLLGNGDGTFQPPVETAFGGQETLIAVGDFNGDGQLDLVGADSAGSADVLLGNGNGTFGAVKNIPLAPTVYGPQAAVAADFNGDGKLDLAVAETTSQNGQISVELGNGDGTFQSPVVSSLNISPINNNGLMVTGDFNGDGKTDVAIAEPDISGFEVLLGNGDGAFQTPVDTAFPAGFQAQNFVTGDFNGDGKTDIAVDGESLVIYLSNGDGTFRAGAQYPVPFNSQVTTADLNHDGKPDLIVTNSGPVEVFLGNGDGTFGNPIAGPNLLTNGPATAADFNGDGKPDVVVSTNNGIAFLAGNGDGTLQPPVYSAPNFQFFGSFLAVDVNGDGKLDLVARSYSGVTVALGNGDGTFQASLVSYSVAGNFPVVMAGDFNSDGSADLAIANNTYANSLSVASLFLSTPTPNLAPTSLSFGSQDAGASSPPQSLTLSNAGNSPMTLTKFGTTGDYSETNNCGASLAISANCQISVTFTPTTAGTRSGSVVITDDGFTSPQTLPLAGEGLAPVGVLSPTALTFNSLLVGSISNVQTVTLSNTGTTSLALSAVTISSNFTQTNNCGNSVASGAKCSIQITFSPQVGGTLKGTLAITDNDNGAGGSRQTVALTGTGQDFSFGPPSGGSTTATVTPGQPAKYTLSLAGLGGLSQSVAFTCAGAPSESTCSISPATATPGSSAQTVTVTVTTTAASLLVPPLRMVPPADGTSQGPSGLWWLLAVVLMGLAAWRIQVYGQTHGCRQKQLVLRTSASRYPALAGLGLLVLMALAMAACGGGGGSGPPPNPGTPAGTYSLTVTGTANTMPKPLTHSVTLTMKVQ